MRVLAFDPGYERLGIAVLEKNKGKEILLYSECVRTAKTLSFPKRLAELGAATETLLKKWKPDCIAIENLYFENNAKTAMNVSAVRGMLLYIAASNNLSAHEYTPLQVKVAVTGYGQANKRTVGIWTLKILGLKSLPAGRQGLDDELDAIAVGITCLASVR